MEFAMIRKNNIHELKSIIDGVSSMIDWVNINTQSSKRLSMVKSLVGHRRKLKKIYNALSDNPTIAAYGESQQGKSYIISSLLSSPGRSLKIVDDNGNKIDFIENINMRTDKQESTGVVTRFTTSKVAINPSFPVKLHLLRITDFITILTDSYMNDITGYQPYGEKDLEGIAQRLIESYSDCSDVQEILTEDDIADIEEYLARHNSVTGSVYLKSGYFDVLSTVIRKVPQDNWVNVFAPLWREDKVFSKLFSMFVNASTKLGYASDVYVSMKAVLNDFNDGCPTLMCVRALDGLKDLLENGFNAGVMTPVYTADGQIRSINKSLLSAMTAEAVYNIESSVLEDDVAFVFDGIRSSRNTTVEENIQMLKNNGIGQSFKKDFLAGVDLLDFPGARGRDMGYPPSQILNQIVTLLLRCKVSYLFHKYSEDLKLSILMFCHSQGNTTPNLVAPILNSWVNTYIGDTPEKRMHNLEIYGHSPLFMVSTMYNLDLIIKKGPVDNQIWQRRLKTILYKEVIDHESNTWFDHWIPGQSFDNTFLLRDYFYSSNANEGNKLFSGYPGPEHEEHQIEERAELKNIFLNDDAVKLFFRNPELAWDVASTMGNDGSYYMLKRLAHVSHNALIAREKQFNEELSEITESVLDLVKGEFHDEEDSELLEKSIKKAKRFHFTLSRACEKQADFFGRMIQFLQVNNNFVASFFSKIIHSNVIVDPADPTDYDIIVRKIEEEGYQFDPSMAKAAIENNYRILEDVFGIMGPDDPLLEGIEPQKLFQSTYRRNCSPSVTLANEFVNFWSTNLTKAENSIMFTQAGFDGIVFSDFITNFTNMMQKARLADKIASAIKEYVDYNPGNVPHNEELIADITANIYNKFVMDLGYDYLTQEDRNKVTAICEKHKLPRVEGQKSISEGEVSSEEYLSHLFSQLEALNDGRGGQLIQLPAYQSMKSWISYVFMSFTIAYDVANYDEAANRELGDLMTEFSSKSAHLS